MKYDEIMKILHIQLEDNKKAYDEIGGEYWFGRIAATEDIMRKITQE